MATLAGVFLIITALLNFFAGMTYVAKGKITSGAANIGEDVVNSVSNVADANDIKMEQKDSISEELGEVKKSGTRSKLLGLFLYLSSVILITAAVFLFQGIQMRFVFAAGIIAIIAETLGIFASKLGVTNAPGLLAGILTIYVSFQFVL